jgi:predicted MFS family arabinose efflux permease
MMSEEAPATPGQLSNRGADDLGERRVVALVGAVQFVNIVDFMMVTPLGQDFAAALTIPLSRLPIVTGSYTAAACISGLIGAFFLDNFDRRKALFLAMIGLGIGTAAGALAWDLPSLVAARIIAGVFGGPATSLGLSMVSDTVPPERRGRAMGAVMGAFAAASVLGVPMGLGLSLLLNWRAPFLVVGALGGIVGAAVFAALPPMTKHLERVRADGSVIPKASLAGLLRFDVGLALTLMFIGFGSSFIIMPSIAPYLAVNLAFPRARLPFMYMLGGVVSFITSRVAGGLSDRLGAPLVGTLGIILYVAVVSLTFVTATPIAPIVVGFAGLFLAMGFRNLPVGSLTSKVPAPSERARYGSLQSAAQHLASAVGAFGSSLVLTERADGGLEHMPRVALLSCVISVFAVPLMFVLERRLRGRAQ